MSAFTSTLRNPLACAMIALLAGVPFAAAEGSIVGSWKTSDGAIIAVAPCGDAFCATVASGAFEGEQVARVSGPGPEFSGRVHDPRSGRSYPGSLTRAGNRIALKGCIMEVFCKTVQEWDAAG